MAILRFQNSSFRLPDIKVGNICYFLLHGSFLTFESVHITFPRKAIAWELPALAA